MSQSVSVASGEQQVEVERLKIQLAEAHAAIADRDAKIAKLAADAAAACIILEQFLRSLV